MREIVVKVDNEEYRMIMNFKKVYDTVVEYESDFNEYMRDVIREGLNKMLTDLPPKNVSVLLKTIQAMFRENPEFVCNFIVQVLKKGSNISQEEEQRIKEIRGHYIS
ncbi:MAG: hypothetical protein DRJ68_04105 [Thermoprotei archaeon]|nr:MAG: hypothetical protein DRJ62_06345 [Thermoprotei archaeon]RLF21169.1 MAG: hypothetical protein DRJ68_04105 [Thermoprotei archaeon]